jgi:hypothetical protein
MDLSKLFTGKMAIFVFQNYNIKKPPMQSREASFITLKNLFTQMGDKYQGQELDILHSHQVLLEELN